MIEREWDWEDVRILSSPFDGYRSNYLCSAIYLWGQLFVSTSEFLRIKSMKALLLLFVGNGGGLGSKVQNLFLANPCASREPRFENCIVHMEKAYLKKKTKMEQNIKLQEDSRTWGKQIGMPPRKDLGGVKLACSDSCEKTRWASQTQTKEKSYICRV